MDRNTLLVLGLVNTPDPVTLKKAYINKISQKKFQTIVPDNSTLLHEFVKIHEAFITVLRHISAEKVSSTEDLSQGDIFNLIFGQSVYFMCRRKYIQASEKFQEALKIRSKHWLSLLYLGILLLKRKNFYAAEKYFTEAGVLAPDSHLPWFYLGENYAAAGNPDKAKMALRKAMTLNPSAEGIAAKIKELEKSRPRSATAKPETPSKKKWRLFGK